MRRCPVPADPRKEDRRAEPQPRSRVDRAYLPLLPASTDQQCACSGSAPPKQMRKRAAVTGQKMSPPPRGFDAVLRAHDHRPHIVSRPLHAPSVRKPSPFSPLGSGSPHTPLRSHRPTVQRHRVTARQAAREVWLSLLSSQRPGGASVCESCRVGEARKPVRPCPAAVCAVKTDGGLHTLFLGARGRGKVARPQNLEV